MSIELLQGDCLELMKDIPDGSVDMILADLPYGTTKLKWDTIIPLEPLWEQYRRIIRGNGAIVLFGSEPFSSKLRVSNIKEYKYDWVWEKSNVTRFLSVDSEPLKTFENIMVFYPERHLEQLAKALRGKRISKGYTKKYMDEMLGTNTLYSFFEGRKLRGETVYSLPNEEHWEVLVDTLGVDRDIYPKDKTFNHVGLKSISKSIGGRKKHRDESHYSFDSEGYTQEYTGYSKDIIKVGTNDKRLHPTQKPVALMEYLIKTYTNEGDTVLDNVMGSGTTGVACKNLNRNFIGMELDEEYFKIAQSRIESS